MAHARYVTALAWTGQKCCAFPSRTASAAQTAAGRALPGSVTANVCKRAIGHEVELISSLHAVVAVRCSGRLSHLLTLRRPALWGRKAAKPDLAEDQGQRF